MLQDIQRLKSLGGNFIRGAHYQQCERFLDLCDENGVLVWEESLGWGNGQNYVDDAMKTCALELSLFGKGVVGRHLGIFAGAMLLSGNVAIDGLTAETFAKEVIAFASLANDLSSCLCSVEEDEANALGHKGQMSDDVFDMHLQV